MSVTSPERHIHLKVSLRDGVLAHTLSLSALILGGLLVIGSAGALHPAGDSFAVLRPFLAIFGLTTAAALILCGAWRRGLVSALLPGLALASLAPHWSSGTLPPGPSLAVYQKNLHYTTTDIGPLARDILRSAPDIVVLQEVHPNNATLLETLRENYPAQVLCPFHTKAGGVALLSRHPFRERSAGCTAAPGMASATLDLASGAITVGAVHLRWPWPKGQAQQAKDLAAEIATLPRPMIIAGDFNMVRWSHTLSQLGRAGGVAPVGRAWITYPDVYVSIDHVFGPNGLGTSEARPLFGSDHKGVLAKIPLKSP